MITHCESMLGREWEDLMPFPATGLSRLVGKTSRRSPGGTWSSGLTPGIPHTSLWPGQNQEPLWFFFSKIIVKLVTLSS